MSEINRDDGQLLIQMIDTWLTYKHPDEMDDDDIARAADLLRRAGLWKYEVEALFELCSPLYRSRDEIDAQRRVGTARFAELCRAFPDDPDELGRPLSNTTDPPDRVLHRLQELDRARRSAPAKTANRTPRRR